ncbi:MAG: aldose 1-epimerase family protein [Pirellulales bacterium]
MKRATLLLLISAMFLATTTGLAAPGMKKVLTSTKDNIRVGDWAYRGTDKATGAAWSIAKKTLHGGKQEGVDLIEFFTGKLKIVVVPTRGMSVFEVQAGGIRLGWNSPVKEIVHPSHINLQSRGGLGWLEGFNEWMVRCGLESAGHPGTDKFINNVGDEASMELTLHGKVGNIPASEVEIVVDEKPPHRIRIRGRVDERMFYGPKLELWTEISAVPGSTEFRIEDQLTNHGDAEQEFQIIYHANYGPPILEKGAKLVAPVKQLVPFNEHAAKSLKQYATYQAPTPGYVEQVYCIFPYADKKGRTTIMLHNATGDKAVTMSWPLKQLPFLTQWKNTLTNNDGYVTGLEPGTGFPYNRRVERKYGRVPKLTAGQSRSFAIDFAILSGSTEVQKGAASIAAIQAGRKTDIQKKPFQTD